MLDIKFVRENPEMVKENIKKKFQDAKPYNGNGRPRPSPPQTTNQYNIRGKHHA